MSSETNQPEKKGLASFRVPHVYVLLFFILIFVAILTYLIPAGEFTRVKDAATGRMIIDPLSYHFVDTGHPAKFFDLFMAIPRGIAAAVDVMFMVVLCIAGMEIINRTGAMQSGVTRLMKAMRGKDTALLVIAMIAMGVLGGFVGWAEGILMFVPLITALCLALGYDVILAMGITVVTATAGFTTGPTNIYTQGVAQGLLKLPLFSGMGFRVVTWVIIMIPTMWYMLRYAKKIKKDPTKSAVYGEKLAVNTITLDENAVLTTRHKLVLVTMVVGLFLAVWGCMKWGWYMKEIGAVITASGVIAGIIAGRKLNDIAEDYAAGAKLIIGAGLTIGMARGVLVIMENAKIIDSVIFYLASAVQNLPTALTAVGIYGVQLIISLFIASASGQAVTTIPILGPVAELAGSTQQVAVLAFQYGDGFTNMLTPTAATLWAALAMTGGIPITKYWKWVWPLMLIWFGFGAIFVTVANVMHLGPF